MFRETSLKEAIMKSIMKLRGSSFGIYLCASSVVLVLLIVLVPTSLVAQADQAQSYKILYTFTGGADGKYPEAGLIRDTDGNLYSTTVQGGASRYGTVFKLDKNGQTVVHSFTGAGADGLYPQAGMIRDSAGNLYGTTADGGTYFSGTVFKLEQAGTETTLYSFTGGSDGAYPYAGLIQDRAGNLYGTTEWGGNYGFGTVFKLEQGGTETILYSFTGGSDGAQPLAGLIRDPAGNLYGTTWKGGDLPACYGQGCGVVFKLDSAGTETVLYAFTGGLDGWAPRAGLIRDAAGNFYGTTYAGGAFDLGTVFKLDPTGTETLLYSFHGPDGSQPYAGLIRDEAGNLYGTTPWGGNPQFCDLGCGVIFKLNATGLETVLHRFCRGVDGAYPDAVLTFDASGNLYGTTQQGGTDNAGVVFRIKP
jgi:uncharacterized repeat protein (TIGR03803 family)